MSVCKRLTASDATVPATTVHRQAIGVSTRKPCTSMKTIDERFADDPCMAAQVNEIAATVGISQDQPTDGWRQQVQSMVQCVGKSRAVELLSERLEHLTIRDITLLLDTAERDGVQPPS